MRWSALSIGVFLLATLYFPSAGFPQASFLRGDANHDETIDLSDAVFTLIYLFVEGREPACLDALDVDDSGSIEITDAIELLTWLFTGVGLPEAPYPVFDTDPTADDLTCLPEVAGPVTEGGSELSGHITQDVTLRSDKTYRLTAGVYFKEGTTLTIEPGVTILGDSESNAFLVIERGATIFAVGTPTHPIVFTSDRPPGERDLGDWGGILVCGRGPANIEGGEWVVKGFSDLWAGGGSDPDPEDFSGRVSYVRIEYSGANVMGAPLSAISFCAVGSRTQLDHIQSKYGGDDGLEWYGGTCSLKYGISVGMADDGVDCEYGWQGRGQFLICLQDEKAGNHGFQSLEDGGRSESEPLTLPTLCNALVLGAWTEGSRSGYGLLVGNHAGIRLFNGVIQGWKRGGIDFRSQVGPVTLDRCVFFDNEDECTGSSDKCSALFEPPLENRLATEPVIADLSDIENPDLRGVATQLPEALDPSSIDEWFDYTDYVGAVPPEGKGEDWTRAPWISWRRE